MTLPIDDETVIARAVQIVAEDRDVYDFGPPPFDYTLDIAHKDRTFTLRLSVFLPVTFSDALQEMLTSAGNAPDPGQALRSGLAYIQAATELASAQMKASAQGEQ